VPTRASVPLPAFHARPGPRGARAAASVQVPGFTLTPGRHSRGTALGWHDHDSPTICCVMQGGFTESWRGGSVICRPGTIKVTPAGDRHCDSFAKSDVRGLLIEVAPDRVDAIRPYSAVLDQRRSLHGGPPAAIARRLQEELRQTDEAAMLAIEGLLLELVATVSRIERDTPARQGPAWLATARDLIHADPTAHLSLAGIAEIVGVHPVTLARGFRAGYGCSVGTYVRRLRVELAGRWLLETDLPLAEIALAAGFCDQSHFSNLFHRVVGVTPSHYRRQAQH
jgi:AraC family transcriptional regulator